MKFLYLFLIVFEIVFALCEVLSGVIPNVLLLMLPMEMLLVCHAMVNIGFSLMVKRYMKGLRLLLKQARLRWGHQDEKK